MHCRYVRSLEPLGLGLECGLDAPHTTVAAAARLSRSATRLARCLGRPASAGACPAAAVAGFARPLSPVFVGPNTFVGSDLEGALSPLVLSPVRPSSAAGEWRVGGQGCKVAQRTCCGEWMALVLL